MREKKTKQKHKILVCFADYNPHLSCLHPSARVCVDSAQRLEDGDGDGSSGTRASRDVTASWQQAQLALQIYLALPNGSDGS